MTHLMVLPVESFNHWNMIQKNLSFHYPKKEDQGDEVKKSEIAFIDTRHHSRRKHNGSHTATLTMATIDDTGDEIYHRSYTKEKKQLFEGIATRKDDNAY